MYNSEKLACNIKKFRKSRGLTQTQLAEKLFMTAQNISKWELGISAPDIEKLCDMAEIFEISTDRLLGLSDNSSKSVMLAIDGGGTKTEFIMFTEQGEILNRLMLSGSNPNSCGMDKTLEVLKNGIERMLEVNTNIVAVYAGLAGVTAGDNRKKILKYLKSNYKNIKFEVQSDILNVVYSTGEHESCTAAICGTGSVVYGKCGDSLNRLGGWGYLFDEAGSGYDIGRDVIRTALEQNDGMSEKTYISTLIGERLNGNIWDKLNIIYSSGKDYIASFAEIAFKAYKSGDINAEKIIDKNADRLAFLINRASEQFKCGNKVIISGGVVCKNKIFQTALLNKLNKRFEVIFADVPQIFGASLNCCRLFAKPDNDFLNIFETNYKKFLEEENA